MKDLDFSMKDQLTGLVLMHKDRLFRFVTELVFVRYKIKQIEVMLTDQEQAVSFMVQSIT